MLTRYALEELEQRLFARGLIDYCPTPAAGAAPPPMGSMAAAPSCPILGVEEDEDGDYFCDLLSILNKKEPFPAPAEPIRKYVEQTLQPGFQAQLFRAIDARGLTDAEVYHRAQIDRRLFAKIRADAGYHPSKSTALALALALHMDRREAEAFLDSAGHALSESLIQDVVVLYFIEHGLYDIIDVNIALAYFEQPPL